MKVYQARNKIVLSHAMRESGKYIKAALDGNAKIKVAPKEEEPKCPELPFGFLEKLRQVRYSDHTIGHLQK